MNQQVVVHCPGAILLKGPGFNREPNPAENQMHLGEASTKFTVCEVGLDNAKAESRLQGEADMTQCQHHQGQGRR